MSLDDRLPSNRSFGTLFVIVFGALAAWQGWRGAQAWMAVWLALAGVTAAVTLARPRWLTPFNRAWMALGHALGRIVSPLVLGLMYAVLIVPVGLFMRLVGRDAMQRRFTSAPTYWLAREDGSIAPERFKNQF